MWDIAIRGSANVKCERCWSNLAPPVEFFPPVDSEVVGMKIHRMVAIKLVKGPIWREE